MKSTAQIAQGFVSARLAATALPGFPGTLPDSLEAAYACQDAAIALWPDEVAGWKVGRIVPPWLARFTAGRLIGPIFRSAGRPTIAPRTGQTAASGFSRPWAWSSRPATTAPPGLTANWRPGNAASWPMRGSAGRR